jgi:hypothetical protein
MKKQVKSFGEFTRLNEGWNDNPEGFTSGSRLSRTRDSERDQYLFKQRSGESGNKPYLGKPARTQTIDKSRGGILLNYYGDHERYEILLPMTGYNYIIGKDLEEAQEFLGRGKREYGVRPETIAAKAQVDMEKYLDSYSPDKFIGLVQSLMDISPERFETPSYYNESRKVNENEDYDEDYDEDYEEYEITAEDEINGQLCKDFNVSDLRVGDIIYTRLIDVDAYTHQWAKDVEKLIPLGLASYSGPYDFEVVGFGDNTIKLK